MGDTQVFVTPDAMTIEVIDRTSPSLEINIDEKRVTVDGAVRPVVNVSYTGGRGPIWLPGNTYDGTSLAAILAGYIGKAQLAQDLLADIDSTITGLVDARVELATAIQANIENGTRIDDVVSRITQAEGTLELSVAKLNAAEANISNAQVFIDDASVRLSAAEGSISDASNYIATQETVLSNEWTVKIQENSDGTACVAGTGLLVYPNWKLDTVYDIDDYSWFDGNAYKAVIAHTASEENVPPNSSYWQLIPYATKSQFGVLAESFFVQTGTGEKGIPFLIQDDQIMVNGDMMVNGLIKAGMLDTNKVYTWSIQSKNYVPGVSGYTINSLTGHVEFNDLDLTINYSDITDAPDPTTIVQTAIDNTLDTTSGGIVVRNTSLNQYAHFTGGDLTFYDYVGSGWVPYKSVTRNITGTCSNGETVNIGYFREQPTILLSPYNMSSYNANYPNQSQVFKLSAKNLRKVNGNWYFDTEATLALSTGSVSVSSNPLQTINGGPIVNTASGSNSGRNYLNWDEGGLGSVPLNPNESFSFTSSNVALPEYTVSVTATIYVKRLWVTSGIDFQYLANISATITLQIYTNETGWTSTSSANLSAIRSASGVETFSIISGSSIYSIRYIRVIVTFTLSNPATYIITGYSENYTQSIQITNCICSLTSAVIAATGNASYLAIG